MLVRVQRSCPMEGEVSLVRKDWEKLPGGSYSGTGLKDEEFWPMEGLEQDVASKGSAAWASQEDG